MQWYYSKNGIQLGPVEQGELVARLASGEVTSTDLVWREGLPDWVPSGQLNELRTVVMPPAFGQTPLPEGTAMSPYAPPGAGAQASPYGGQEIPNYLWQSIVVTILCCWPLGIPAIVYAAKVDGLKARGDITGAMAASASAKTWCWVALGLGLGVLMIYALAVGVGIASR
ncbi:MAG: CD225/dispanin family protein [Verrucomicrobia bacterium]|nr:CD225/dispanin family protein [Verrucomicrobiota bacterium]